MINKKGLNILAFLLVTLTFAVMAGCYTPAGRSAGEVIDDSTITTMVKANMFDAEELNGFAISVKTFEGVVTLTGAVDTMAQKNQAENIAKSVRGVRGVNNLLVNK